MLIIYMPLIQSAPMMKLCADVDDKINGLYKFIAAEKCTMYERYAHSHARTQSLKFSERGKLIIQMSILIGVVVMKS